MRMRLGAKVVLGALPRERDRGTPDVVPNLDPVVMGPDPFTSFGSRRTCRVAVSI